MKIHDYSRNILNLAEVPQQQTNGDTRGRNGCRGEEVQRVTTLPKYNRNEGVPLWRTLVYTYYILNGIAIVISRGKEIS